MSVPTAYLGIILIWSTTPLAIKWSGEGPGFIFAVASRMTLGLFLCLAIMAILSIPMPWHAGARKTYLAAGLGIYSAMLSVYWAAQFIPSGLISVVFGLTPMVTGLFAAVWLHEAALTPIKFLGMALGLAGLVVIFGLGESLNALSLMGVSGVMISVLCHSASAVTVKRIGAKIPALAMVGGGLLVAVPLFVATWIVVGEGYPAALPLRAGLSIIYLGVVGSVLGFMLYFYVLKRVPAVHLALLTLVSPVTALLLGHWLNDEVLSSQMVLGSTLVLGGLCLHQWGQRLVLTVTGRRAKKPLIPPDAVSTN